MAEAAAVMMVGGAGLGVTGTLRQGDAARRAAYYNAEVADNNAQLSREQAAEDERRFRLQARRFLGDTRAAIGASGIAFEGSAIDVMRDSAANAELDALTIRHQGEVRARGFQNEARMLRFQGDEALQASYYGAAANVLNAGGRLAAGGGGG